MLEMLRIILLVQSLSDAILLRASAFFASALSSARVGGGRSTWNWSCAGWGSVAGGGATVGGVVLVLSGVFEPLPCSAAFLSTVEESLRYLTAGFPLRSMKCSLCMFAAIVTMPSCAP